MFRSPAKKRGLSAGKEPDGNISSPLGLFRSTLARFLNMGSQESKPFWLKRRGSVPMALNSVDWSFEKQTVTIKLHRSSRATNRFNCSRIIKCVVMQPSRFGFQARGRGILFGPARFHRDRCRCLLQDWTTPFSWYARQLGDDFSRGDRHALQNESSRNADHQINRRRGPHRISVWHIARTGVRVENQDRRSRLSGGAASSLGKPAAVHRDSGSPLTDNSSAHMKSARSVFQIS